MSIEDIRNYCLTFPQSSEAFPFDDTTLVFRVVDKIFVALDLNRPEWVTMKCDPDYAIILRDAHLEIEGAWHWNKKYWNQVSLYGSLEPDFIRSLIRHSFDEVVKKMSKKKRAEYGL